MLFDFKVDWIEYGHRKIMDIDTERQGIIETERNEVGKVTWRRLAIGKGQQRQRTLVRGTQTRIKRHILHMFHNSVRGDHLSGKAWLS